MRHRFTHLITFLTLVALGSLLVAQFATPVRHMLEPVVILLSSLVLLFWGGILVKWGITSVQNVCWGWLWQRCWRTLPKVSLPAFEWKRKRVTVAPVQDLVDLCLQVRTIRLALYGTTLEQEEARRQWYQQRKQPLPDLVLPQRNTMLSADFCRLTTVMDLIGFPEVARISLETEDLAFLKAWADELQMKIAHTQLPDIVASSLDRLIRESRHVYASYPTAVANPKYFRVAGALALLEQMAKDSRVPVDVVAYCVRRLTQDLASVRQDLHQASARLLVKRL